jgi:uncharacterized protein YpmB
MRKLLKNKKGDIPVTILVFGIIVVCMLAIVSFYVSSLNIKKNFDFQAVKEIKLMKEKIDVYTNLELSKESINSILNIHEDSGERYLFLDRGYISINYTLPR